MQAGSPNQLPPTPYQAPAAPEEPHAFNNFQGNGIALPPLSPTLKVQLDSPVFGKRYSLTPATLGNDERLTFSLLPFNRANLQEAIQGQPATDTIPISTSTTTTTTTTPNRNTFLLPQSQAPSNAVKRLRPEEKPADSLFIFGKTNKPIEAGPPPKRQRIIEDEVPMLPSITAQTSPVMSSNVSQALLDTEIIAHMKASFEEQLKRSQLVCSVSMQIIPALSELAKVFRSQCHPLMEATLTPTRFPAFDYIQTLGSKHFDAIKAVLPEAESIKLGSFMEGFKPTTLPAFYQYLSKTNLINLIKQHEQQQFNLQNQQYPAISTTTSTQHRPLNLPPALLAATPDSVLRQKREELKIRRLQQFETETLSDSLDSANSKKESQKFIPIDVFRLGNFVEPDLAAANTRLANLSEPMRELMQKPAADIQAWFKKANQTEKNANEISDFLFELILIVRYGGLPQHAKELTRLVSSGMEALTPIYRHFRDKKNTSTSKSADVIGTYLLRKASMNDVCLRELESGFNGMSDKSKKRFSIFRRITMLSYLSHQRAKFTPEQYTLEVEKIINSQNN